MHERLKVILSLTLQALVAILALWAFAVMVFGPHTGE
jgi:hypothetical protein